MFVSVVFLHGPAKYLFTPLGMAVVFAMLASYGLSRTLTPITIGLLLKNERRGAEARRGWFARLHGRFEHGFERMRARYAALLAVLLRRRMIVPVQRLIPMSGRHAVRLRRSRFLPAIDGGQIQLHVRAPAGTRIEKTEQIFQAIEDKIREVIPADEREMIVDNIGLPARTYNYAFGDGTAIGVNDGVILVALKEGPSADRALRPQAATGSARQLPRGHLLLPGRRHGDPDPQFRHSGADQRAHRRL